MPTSSNTYNFSPGLGELTLYAFNVAGLRNTSLLQEHMTSARMAANLMLGVWSSKGVNLWQVELVTVPLVQGQTTYAVDPTTIAMLDAYVTQNDGSQFTDRTMLPISRSEYANYPNKQMQGFPTVFWFDRLLSPTVTLWPVPDGQQTTFNYYRIVQNQDANFTSGQLVNIPQYWFEAFAYGLAFRLAVIWNPTIAQGLKSLADESYEIAALQNEETSNWFITPLLGSYYR